MLSQISWVFLLSLLSQFFSWLLFSSWIVLLMISSWIPLPSWMVLSQTFKEFFVSTFDKLEWTESTCFFRFDELKQIFSHESHLYFFSFLWTVLICVFNPETVEQALPHESQIWLLCSACLQKWYICTLRQACFSQLFIYLLYFKQTAQKCRTLRFQYYQFAIKRDNSGHTDEYTYSGCPQSGHVTIYLLKLVWREIQMLGKQKCPFQ